MDNRQEWIRVVGAREHNLKSIDVAIPKNKLTVITGPSGSGKSSLALDILFTEGKRRYVESLSSYARQFLGIAKKPEVDRIDGLCPAIAIEQKTVGANPRSTVGTITEIYDYLRVLFARIGVAHCPQCHTAVHAESPETISEMVTCMFAQRTIHIAAPIASERKGEFTHELKQLFAQGFYRFLIDGSLHKFRSEQDIEALKLKKTFRHTINLIVDTCEVIAENRTRVFESIETAFKLSAGECVIIAGDQEHRYSSQRMCVRCALSIPELEPRLFSFNSPLGACPECNGLGSLYAFSWEGNEELLARNDSKADHYSSLFTCRMCHGKRLNPYASAVTVHGKNISDLAALSCDTAHDFFMHTPFAPDELIIAQGLITEILNRLSFLQQVGLSYLSLDRSARTLSGGEGQRIRLATQIGSSLSGVLYILDEPSIGLHQKDNDRLIQTLKKLRDQGNTVVVVEHDMDTIKHADYVIDMGPAAGLLGGKITAYGTPEELAHNAHSLTGLYLSGKRAIKVPEHIRTPYGHFVYEHASKNNLKNITVPFPLGVLCGVSGVSGSGKSTLIMQELVPALERELVYKRNSARQVRRVATDLKGAELLDALVVIDQSPIGRTPRSNPATYLGIFDEIRALFAQLPESNARGYTVGRFSFNVAQGRCFECRGDGIIKVSMQFLPDVTMICKMCNGARYNRETLQIRYKGKSIAEVLTMTAHEALSFFAAHTRIVKRLQLMCDVGLDYVALGQPSTTLSGGEAQRIKLVDELAKRGARTLYILDEPTTGLHSSDIEKLLIVLNRLVDKGNSMIVIEHNIDVLKTVDYLIDLGPEGGVAGGSIVVQGTPAQVAQCLTSHTGKYLKPFFSEKRASPMAMKKCKTS